MTITPAEDSRGRHATGRGQNFAGVIGWTVLGAVAPGSGLIAAGRRLTGATVLSITAAFVSAVLTYLVLGDPVTQLVPLLTKPGTLLIVALLLGLGFLAWAAVVVATHASLRRFARLSTGQGVVGTLLVTALVATMALPVYRFASDTLLLRSTIQTLGSKGHTGVGGPKAAQADPWAGTSRVNVLVMGSDAGSDRDGIRPDTMIVASIDTQNGQTVLFSLPRNLQHVPFPPNTPMAARYPNGFVCYNAQGNNLDCLLNGFWTFGVQHWKEFYADQPTAFDAGLKATREAAEQVTGLPIDQYAMVNLRGFMAFVDAVGGLTVNVYERLPIGGDSDHHYAPGGWIEPGMNQHFDGWHALWYGRSRWSTSDYSRMERQRCLVGAISQQVSPMAVAGAFPKLAKSATENVYTDIPTDDFAAWIQLALKIKKTKVRSLPFTESVINTVHPDFDKIRRLVQEAIAPQPSSASPSPSSTSSSRPSSNGSSSPSKSSTAQDVSQVC